MAAALSNPAISRLYERYGVLGEWRLVAKELNVSAAYISDIINGRRAVSARVARKLGCERRIEYVRTTK